MKPEEMREGLLYVLTCDVENPAPDRRKAREFSALPIWKAGVVFRARLNEPQEIDGVKIPQSVRSLEALYNGERYGNDLGPDKVGVVLPHLTPREAATPDEVLALGGDGTTIDWRNQAGEILDRLHKRRLFTLDDVRSTLAAWLAEDDGKPGAP